LAAEVTLLIKTSKGNTMNFNQRRDFIKGASLLAAGGILSGTTTSLMADETPSISKPVVKVYEFKIAGAELKQLMKSINDYKGTLKSKKGYLGLSLKQKVGDSTMVNNFAVEQKGILKDAFEKAAHKGQMPFFFSLFIRFDSLSNLQHSAVNSWFEEHIQPQLFAYKKHNGKPMKLPLALDYKEGIYTTVAAGDREGIYHTKEEIINFYKHQVDIPNNPHYPDIKTVQNHVKIHAENTHEMNKRVSALLKIAQNTYRPAKEEKAFDAKKDPHFVGQAGKLEPDNYFYKKALTTEILQNIHTEGETRSYLMHGVWESVADHENSHIDPRFKKAAGPVGALVIEGPVEPFYSTKILDI